MSPVSRYCRHRFFLASGLSTTSRLSSHRVRTTYPLDDTRKALEFAVGQRQPCHVGRPGGKWAEGTLYRLEAAGLVCSVPGHDLSGGEEVRLRFEVDECSHYFEASVLRTAVPVPDRGAHGVMLGFLSSIPMADSAQYPNCVLEIRLPGESISLLADPVKLIEVTSHQVAFEVPSSFPLVFVSDSVLHLCIAAPPVEPYELRGRVSGLVRGHRNLHYTIDLEQVERLDDHQRAISTLTALRTQ